MTSLQRRSLAMRIQHKCGGATIQHIMQLLDQGWSEAQIIRSITVPAI